MKIDLKEEFRDIFSLKCIVAWLKSPILLSMLDLLYDSCDLFDNKILYSIPIIMNDLFKKDSNIEKYVNEIINLEYDILKLIKSLSSQDKISKAIENHNKKVSKLAVKIDEEIKLAIDIQEDEYKIVLNFIENKNWSKIFNKQK